jgi:hypothetical protein
MGEAMRLNTIGSLALAAAMVVPAGTALAQEASPTAEATLSPAAQAFAEAFPAEVGGVSLADLVEVSPADAPDVMDAEVSPMLEEVADGLGVGLGAVLVGQAATFTDLFDEDADGAWIIAIQIPGMDPATGSDLMVRLFTTYADEDWVITETEVAERPVTRVASVDDAEAAFNVYAGGDMAWVVMTASTELLEEAISQLP